MSKYVDPLSMRWFEEDVKKIAALTGRTLVDALKQQAGLAARDAMRVTPPFGKSPIKEAFGVQRKMGNNAIEKDVSMTFKPLKEYRIFGREWHFEHGDIGLRIKKAVRGGKRQDLNLAEALLNKVGLKPLAVIEKANIQLMRQKTGKRLRVSGRAYRVINAASIKKLTIGMQTHVGEAKAGWMRALRMFDRTEKLPAWITRHGDNGGIAFESPSETKPVVTVGNSIDYVQDRAPAIVDLVWRIRYHAARAQVGHIERSLKAKAKRELATATVA